jgi:monooxygenase
MASGPIEYTDVLIVGAGLSGVGAACQLRQARPEKSVVVLEARDAVGGTWDLFRYPGIRSDSDMFTLGYRFSPWTDAKAIADGPSILRYIHDTAEAFGVDELVRLNHRVVKANWDSDEARWTVEVHRTDTGETAVFSCVFLYVCSGYYRYDEGFSPKFPGAQRFRGPIIHPQHWPEDLDYRDKRVIVIGSGATAVTLVPTLAESAAHVTMLQRSPTYIAARPASDAIADRLRAWLPQKLAYAIVRWKNALQAIATFTLSRRRPELMKSMLRTAAVNQLPDGYAVDTHFAPSYNPWDQRMCLIPDGDLFTAISSGRASVVTDHIETFTETGIRLRSGADLVAEYVCRLLKHMDDNGYAAVMPDSSGATAANPFLDLASGYVQRALADLPKQGEKTPWRLHQNYVRDIRLMRRGLVDDDVVFTPAVAASDSVGTAVLQPSTDDDDLQRYVLS